MALKNLYHYLGQNEELRKAREFWQWFKEHQAAYLFINDVAADEKEKLLDELLTELHRYNPNLFFEMGDNEQAEQPELLFTAEGVAEHFPSLELLWEMAPVLKEWNFIAFKPPLRKDFIIEIAELKFNPREIHFIPLPKDKAQRRVNIRVIHPDYSDENRKIFLHGTLHMLHALLGEKSNALDIGLVEIEGVEKAHPDQPKRPLSEIASYISQEKAAGD